MLKALSLTLFIAAIFELTEGKLRTLLDCVVN